jgi:hypothetical protein
MFFFLYNYTNGYTILNALNIKVSVRSVSVSKLDPLLGIRLTYETLGAFDIYLLTNINICIYRKIFMFEQVINNIYIYIYIYSCIIYICKHINVEKELLYFMFIF